jgi:hypothetical protein
MRVKQKRGGIWKSNVSGSVNPKRSNKQRPEAACKQG